LFYPNLALTALRIVSFALLSAAVALALRGSFVERFIPFSLALIALLMQSWDIMLYPFPESLPLADWGFVLPAVCTAIGLWLLSVSQNCLANYSLTRSKGLILTSIVLLMLLPFLLGLMSFLPAWFSRSALIIDISGFASQWFFIPMHVLSAQSYPGVYQITYDPNVFHWIVWPYRYAYYGGPLPAPAAFMIVSGLHILTIGMWWDTAQRCLTIARSPLGQAAD
jgi:hypothetical protein